MRIRLAGVSDAAALTRLINAAFLVEKFFIEGDRIDTGAVEEHLRKGEFLVAEDDDGLAGCVYLEPRQDHTYLGLLSVDPDRQRSGLGSLLMNAAEEHARGRGSRAMDLRIVSVRLELPSFYTRHGYVETGTEPLPEGTPTLVPCHFVNMTKAI